MIEGESLCASGIPFSRAVGAHYSHFTSETKGFAGFFVNVMVNLWPVYHTAKAKLSPWVK